MDTTKVYVEAGKKKVFVGAMDWPGWCRSGKSEAAALQALVDYGPRYGRVLQGTGIKLELPTSLSDLEVVERLQGNATTDYGAPGGISAEDRELYDVVSFKRDFNVLEACWRAFDQAVKQAAGRELRKGPRGGGMDLEKLVTHLLGSDQAYLSKVAWKFKLEEGIDTSEGLRLTREATREALDKAVNEGLPEKGPRGGEICTP